MTVERMYLALFAAAAVAGSLLRLLDSGVAGVSSARGLGETIGGVIALFLVAALVPTVMVLLARKPVASAASPAAVGMVALAVFAYLSYRGSEVERSMASFVFQPPGCTFSASFPGEPERRELVVAGGLVVTQANFYGSDTLLRAECFATAGWFAPTRAAVMAELRKHAERNGLVDLEFEVIEPDGFSRGLARGWKTVGGRPATYEVHLLADGVSIMGLVAGGLSSGYPQPGLYEFLVSGTHLDVGTR